MARARHLSGSACLSEGLGLPEQAMGLLGLGLPTGLSRQWDGYLLGVGLVAVNDMPTKCSCH